MDYQKLARLLFPQVKETLEDLEARFPLRDLPADAKVTRLGPSPTGFIHLGNLYMALANERLAHQSEGVFFLRIEDTDDKRKVEGAEELILEALGHYDICFDEGVVGTEEKGSYGPYHQSERKDIYHIVAADLVRRGLAYPSFITQEELDLLRQKQEAQKVTPGYYGKWATERNLTYEEVKEKLQQDLPWTLRFKADDAVADVGFSVPDGIRGHVTVHPNTQDAVLLKTNGIPTYHFAHVVDDHFMRTTHVLRGEEWLSTLPLHIALFEALGWEHPLYCHTAHLMKHDEETGTRRKLSKRKDPELSLSYYMEMGYHPKAVREYLMVLLNSNYEMWRIENPDAPLEAFTFSLDTMASSGALFDIEKLNNIAKDVFLAISAEDIAAFFIRWAKVYRPEKAKLYEEEKDAITRLFDIGRSGNKPRKDLVRAEQMETHIGFYFDDSFAIEGSLPERITPEMAKVLLQGYAESFDIHDDNSAWFEKVRNLAEAQGFAAKPKDYKKNPEAYKGHVGDVSGLIRLAVTGRENAPDLWSVQQILGAQRVQERLSAFEERL